MNEQLQSVLTALATDLITKIQNGIDAGAIFVSEKAPLLISEIIKIRILTHMMGVVIFSLLTVATIVLLVFLSKGAKKSIEKYDDSDAYVVGLVFSCIGLVCFIGGIIGNIYGLMYIKLAPQLFIISELKKLL